jgi:hypothetical protein
MVRTLSSQAHLPRHLNAGSSERTVDAAGLACITMLDLAQPLMSVHIGKVDVAIRLHAEPGGVSH